MSCGRRSSTRGAAVGASYLAAVAAVATVTVPAAAAPPNANGDTAKFKMSTNALSAGPAEQGRARVREGDCKGALAFFDAALRTSIDPTLYRDRGLCHDKLGDVYPAIDDYRAYVFGDPDAPDVETIRARILELQGNAPPAEGDEESTNGTQANIDRVSRGEVIARPRTEKRVPLKGGSGFGVGAYFGTGGLFFNDPNSTSTTYEKLGIQLRADFRPAHAIVLEGGYFHLDDASESNGATYPGGGGYDFYLGYEARIRLNRAFDNQLLLGIGGSITRFSESLTSGGISGQFAQLLYGPAAKIGYRHVFSNTLAVDLVFEPAYLFDHPTASATSTTGVSTSVSTNDVNAVQIGGYIGIVLAP